MQAKGYMGQLVYDIESSFGQAPTTAAGTALPFNKCELKASQTIITPATISGTRNPVEPGRGHIAVDGSVEIPMDTNAIGFWLKAMFGAPVTTGAAAPYTHVFKPSNNQPSLVLEKGFKDIGQYFKYSGCKINTFKMTAGDDGELTASMDILGANEVVGSTPYMATPDSVTLDRLNNFQGVLKENGVPTATIKTLELDLAFGLDSDQYVLGSIGRGDIPEGLIEVSGTIKALFNDIATIQKGINATETKLELDFTNGDKQLNFLMPEVQYERTSPTITGPAGVVAEFKFSGYYKNAAEASAIVVTLINSTETY